MAAADLEKYVRTIRPTLPVSFPPYVERELDRIAIHLNNLLSAYVELEARVAALEAP